MEWMGLPGLEALAQGPESFSLYALLLARSHTD